MKTIKIEKCCVTIMFHVRGRPLRKTIVSAWFFSLAFVVCLLCSCAGLLENTSSEQPVTEAPTRVWQLFVEVHEYSNQSLVNVWSWPVPRSGKEPGSENKYFSQSIPLQGRKLRSALESLSGVVITDSTEASLFAVGKDQQGLIYLSSDSCASSAFMPFRIVRRPSLKQQDPGNPFSLDLAVPTSCLRVTYLNLTGDTLAIDLFDSTTDHRFEDKSDDEIAQLLAKDIRRRLTRLN